MTDIERLIDQFLAYIDVERGLAKATVRAYDSDLRKYNGWLATQGIQDLNAVTTQDVERYIAFLDDSGESARSKARRLASIHAFHRFALNEHVVSNDVAAQVKATENVAVDMICDCYEPFTKTQLLKEEVELEEVVSRPSSQNTIREMVEMGTGTPSVSGVYDVITRPYITKAQIQRGKLLAEGKIEAYILYLTDSNESPVYSMKKELPFSYMLDCESTYSDLIPEIKAEVKHTAYNLNVAGEIEIRCILSLNANIIRKRKIELVNEVVTEPLENGDKNGIVIYFVQKGDNLWEIAKRYAVPQSEILRFNNMEESDKLEIGNRLFIPSI